MIVTSILTTAVLAATLASAQDDQGPIRYDTEHNVTAITGTWSTGSRNVLTGPNFANPANMTFNYPKTTGESYSFSDSGHYEIARYRFNGNGSEPTCITGVISWVHGFYTLNANGSITLEPFGDGYQQVQDPCAAESNFIEFFNYTEYMRGWRIFQDPRDGPKLHLFMHNGVPVAPMFQVSVTPEMLPTRRLRNVSAPLDFQTRELAPEAEEGAAVPRGLGRSSWTLGVVAASGLALVAVLL